MDREFSIFFVVIGLIAEAFLLLFFIVVLYINRLNIAESKA